MGLFGRGPEAGHGEAILEVGAEVVHPADWEHDVETELVDVNVNSLVRAPEGVEGGRGRLGKEWGEGSLRVAWKGEGGERGEGGRKEGRKGGRKGGRRVLL